MKHPTKSHPGHGGKRGRPGALPKLAFALTVRLHRQTTLACAGCSRVVETAYVWPDDLNPGSYTMVPQCALCATLLVEKQLPVALNPSVLDAEFSIE